MQERGKGMGVKEVNLEKRKHNECAVALCGSHIERLGHDRALKGPPVVKKGPKRRSKSAKKARHPGATRVSCFLGAHLSKEEQKSLDLAASFIMIKAFARFWR